MPGFQRSLELSFERLLPIAKRCLGWSRGRKRVSVILLDATLCIFAIWLAFSTRLGVWVVDPLQMAKVAAGALPMWFVVAWRMGIYKAIFRFAGAGTMIKLAAACIVLTVPMTALYLIYGLEGVPRTVAVLQPAFFLLLLAASRIFGRYLLIDLLNARDHRGSHKRALIYGVGLSAQQLAASVRIEAGVSLFGFVSPDPKMSGHTIDSVPVIAEPDLAWMIERHDISDVFLTFEGENRAERSALVSRLEELNVHIQLLPPIRELVDKRVSVSALREIQITDILGRDTVQPYMDLMRKHTTGRTVLVTGGGGSIGGELARQIAELRPAKLVLADSSEFNLYSIDRELRERLGPADGTFELVAELVNCADRDGIRRTIERHSPHTVFHAAAYKHVPLIESNIISGVRNNVLGTYYTVRAAQEAGVERFVLISTDKAVRPTNVMGASKRVCEVILQALADDGRGEAGCILSMVRFGNVLGSSGSVVPQFERQIRAGGPVTVTHRDMTRYFMTIPEAAQLVIQAGAIAEGGEVFVLDMGEPVRIVDLARTMIRLSGQTERDEENPDGDIEIVEIGLRPGEKLFEELFIGASHRRTSHPQILMAHERYIPWDEMLPMLREIEQDVGQGNASVLRSTLQTLVAASSELADESAPARTLSASRHREPLKIVHSAGQ